MKKSKTVTVYEEEEVPPEAASKMEEVIIESKEIDLEPETVHESKAESVTEEKETVDRPPIGQVSH